MVAVVDVDKSRINSPSSSLPKSSGEDKCEPLPSHWRSPSIHLNAGEAMERRPRRSCLLVSGELPHDAGETNGATNSARIPFSSPAYCASMQSKRRGSELGSGNPPRLQHTAPQQMNHTATAGMTTRSTRLPSSSPAIRRPISLKSGESGDWIPFRLHLKVEGTGKGE